MIKNALKKKRKALIKRIKEERERIAKISKEEEVIVDEDDDEDLKKETSEKIIKRWKTKIEKLEKFTGKYKDKISKLTDDIKEQSKTWIDTKKDVSKHKEMIEIKTQEVLELTKTLKEKQEYHEKNPTITTIVKEYEEIKETITKTTKKIKEVRKDYVKATSEELSVTKMLEFWTEIKKEYEETLHIYEEEIDDAKVRVTDEEEKQKIIKKI